MALVWADNFAWYTTGHGERYYSELVNSVVGPYGRAGGPGGRMPTQTDSFQRSALTTSGATYIIGLDLYVEAAPTTTNVLTDVKLGSTTHVEIDFNSSGQILAYRDSGLTNLLGTASYVVPLNKWIHVNVRVVISNSGSVLVKVTEDDTTTTVLNLTGVDTQNGGTATWDYFSASGTNNTGTRIANLVVQDGSGTRNNDLLGPVDVLSVYPNGTGASALFAPSSGVDPWRMVDELTGDDDASYNDADTVNQLDVHAMQDTPNPDVTIYGVVLVNVAREEGGNATLAPVLRQDSTNTVGSGVALTGSYLAYPKPYDTLPDGAPWTPARWNAAHAGYKRTA